MTSNLKIGVDFISNMPDPILQLILQGLPNTEEVVRTSVLSTRWRYLWTSIPYFPSLNLDCDRVLNPSVMFREKEFSDFVSWALANETVDLDSFRLSCAGYYKSSVVNRWIKAAVNRKVKSLDLMFDPEDTNYGSPYGVRFRSVLYLPGCLIMSESLESLRLFTYRSPITFFTCTGFVVLKVLELNNVYCFKHDSAEEFLKKFPVLEELSLIDCLISNRGPIYISSTKLRTLIIRNWKNLFSEDYPYVWCALKVSCPELVSFEYVGLRGEVILEDVNSLKKAVIHPNDMLQRKVSPTSGKTVSKLLAGISHVDYLSLNLYFIQVTQSTFCPSELDTAEYDILKNYVHVVDSS